MYYWRKPANTNILQLPLASRGSFSLNTPRRIVAYLDGLPPSLRFEDLRQAKINALGKSVVHQFNERSVLWNI
jgi:hypothetical protein